MDRSHRFTWNGLDAYNREVQGLQLAKIRVGWVYDGDYQVPAANFNESFGSASGNVNITADAMRQEIAIWTSYKVFLGEWKISLLGMGGTSLTA